MEIKVVRVEYKEVEAMRDLYRHEANCQIIHDSALVRCLADPILILVNGRIGGYGALWNKYHVGRLMEFYVLPHFREIAHALAEQLLYESKATHIEAQTNMPMMLTVLHDFTISIEAENILFADDHETNLPCPDGVFRRSQPDDSAALPPDQQDRLGEWVIEASAGIVATSGFLCHYNPPYGDIYMEVFEPARRRGFGAYIVQETKRVCYEAGRKPAARCNPNNRASRRTLEKAGFITCGRLLSGAVRTEAIT
jgi:FR47-like protein